ncbi:MAG: hypothetical protein HN348_28400, partial [Proteobacteria bacterium]|nr:hypothetical protein [Pseudomonadota bacterium]
LTRLAFKEGAGSSLEVTDARRAAASADIGLATSRLEQQLAALVLLRAVGEDVFSLATAERS